MSINDIALDITAQEYRDLPALSYSLLSAYDRMGYASVIAEPEPPSPQMTFGSAVDCLVTEGEEAFKDRYVAADDMPSPSEKSVIDSLLQSDPGVPFLALVSDTELLAAADAVGYQTRFKPETRVSKLRQEGARYYALMMKGRTRVILSQEDYDDVIALAQAFKESPLTGKYFSEGDGVELLFQVKLLGTEKISKLPFKGMLDMVRIDHGLKEIQVCDIKTTVCVYNFTESFWKWRYYIQAAMYQELMLQTLYKAYEEYRGYVLKPFVFLAADRRLKKPVPFLWQSPERVTDPYGTERESWKDLLVKANWAVTHREEGMPEDWEDSVRRCGAVTIRNGFA